MDAEHQSIKKKYDAYRIRSFAILWFVYGGYYLCRNCYFVAKPAISNAVDLSNAQLGIIDLAFLSTYAIGQFINGPLGDRFNNKLMIGAGMTLSVLMAVLFGISNTLPLFVLFWAINGYAQSTGWTSCVKSMDKWFTPKERGTIMGFWSTCYQVVGFFARILAAASIGWFGWRYAFFNPAAVMLLITIVFLFLHANSPGEAGLPPLHAFYGESNANSSGQNSVVSLKEESHGSVVRGILRIRTLWVVGVAFFCITFVRYAMMSWLSKYLYDALHLSETTAGYHSAIPEMAGLLGTILAGYISDRYFQSRRGPVTTLMLMGLTVGCAVQGWLASQGIWWNLAGLCFIYFMLNGPISILVGTAAMDFGGGRGTATAAGIINGMGAIGATIQGPFIGWLSEKYGWGFFFYLFIGLSILATILMATLWNKKPAK
jgi:sugar phosphate permease